MTLSRTLAAVAVATLTFTSFAANAGTLRMDGNQVTKKVVFNSADLQSEQTARTVYAEISNVAAEVCVVDGAAPASVVAEDRDCMERAIDGAVADLNSDALRQVHDNARAAAPAYARNDR